MVYMTEFNQCGLINASHLFLLTGTTWTQEVVTLIRTRGNPGLSQTVENWKRAPWLEHYYSSALLEALPTTARVITTHLPHDLLGPALQHSKTKVIKVHV